jgi:hypothetical protein
MRVLLTGVLDSQAPILAADSTVPGIVLPSPLLPGIASVKIVAESLFMSRLHFLRNLEPTHQSKVPS